MTATRTYLDHNASSPLRPAARAAMLAALDATGNPSSVHAEGRRARAIIDTAREQVAALVGAKPSEVVFTSGATEANNCVMAGGWKAICVSAIEHDSVLAPARASGAKVIALPASTDGVVDLQAVAGQLAHAASGGARALLSVMMANNETGVIQPVAEAAALAREHGAVAARRRGAGARAPAGQLRRARRRHAGRLRAQARRPARRRRADRARRRQPAGRSIKGGGQERRRRGGTENVAGIAGFGAAAAEVAREADAAQRMAGAARQARGRRHGGDAERRHRRPRAPRASPTPRASPLPGKPAETLVIRLDLEGVAVSAGAACSSGKVGANSVLEAMGLGAEIARSAVRVSLGPQTSEDDIAAFLAAWEQGCRPARRSPRKPTNEDVERVVDGSGSRDDRAGPKIDVDQYKYGFETKIESVKAPKGLSEDTVRFISAKKGEPEWMLEWRLEAYRRWLHHDRADVGQRHLSEDRLPGPLLLLRADNRPRGRRASPMSIRSCWRPTPSSASR